MYWTNVLFSISVQEMMPQERSRLWVAATLWSIRQTNSSDHRTFTPENTGEAHQCLQGGAWWLHFGGQMLCRDKTKRQVWRLSQGRTAGVRLLMGLEIKSGLPLKKEIIVQKISFSLRTNHSLLSYNNLLTEHFRYIRLQMSNRLYHKRW